ncbi:MAG: sigma-70 family RNA polymerase sigma factor [Planctomycetes bacterium]|nr:sigma-70 family RNA polymerase sigma factor [Planctomycetota bacterium]
MARQQQQPGHVWTAFYLANRRSLGTYALSLTGNAADAQDLIQDTLLRMVRQNRPVQDARAYVLRCLRNLAIDRHRRAGRLPSVASLAGDGLAFMDADALTRQETFAGIRSALRTLPEQRREIIVLKVYAELSFREIAEILGIPPGTAASHYTRGLAEMRTLLRTEPHHV